MEHSLQGIRVRMTFSHQFNEIWFGRTFLAFIGRMTSGGYGTDDVAVQMVTWQVMSARDDVAR